MVRHRLVAWYALPALPPLAVTIAIAVMAVGEMTGSHPLTIGAPRNVAEAIAMGDAAAAARLVETGANVSDVALIRPGILADGPVLATPLEAAVIRDQAGTVEFLVARGATAPSDLRCLARDVGARSVQQRVGGEAGCRIGDALHAVMARP